MTTTVNFAPSNTSNFQFNCTLDQQIYTVIITSNLFGNRYYINVYDLDNNLIVSRPLTGSPPDYPINLVAGYFETSTLVFFQQSQQFVIAP